MAWNWAGWGGTHGGGAGVWEHEFRLGDWERVLGILPRDLTTHSTRAQEGHGASSRGCSRAPPVLMRSHCTELPKRTDQFHAVIGPIGKATSLTTFLN